MSGLPEGVVAEPLRAGAVDSAPGTRETPAVGGGCGPADGPAAVTDTGPADSDTITATTPRGRFTIANPLPQTVFGYRLPHWLRNPVGFAVAKANTGLLTFGRFVELSAQAMGFLVVDIVRLRHPWRDAVIQAWFILSVTVVPAFLVSIPFGVIVAVQAGNVIQQVGAASISGAASGLGVMQQGAPIVAALLLGGAAGSAVATDLGARSIREEVDALRVMGINPVQRLVAPRLSAIIFVSPLLCIFIVFVGLFAGYFINVGLQSGTPGSYLASFASFANVDDFIVSVFKTLLFGVVVMMVACQRGLETKGGPRGVADSVNATVVIGVVTVMVLNAVITQLVTMIMPTKLG